MPDQFVNGHVVVDRAIGFWIHRVYQAARNEMYRAFREAGHEVTPEQWAVLIRLWEEDGRTQAELSEATFRDAPTMSRIVAGMEARGLVERRADPADGRLRRVFLTPDARRLERVLVPVAEDLVGRMLAGVPDRDLGVTRATLARMFDNLAG